MFKRITLLFIVLIVLAACSNEARTDDYIWKVTITNNGEESIHYAEDYYNNGDGGIMLYDIKGKVFLIAEGKNLTYELEKIKMDTEDK